MSLLRLLPAFVLTFFIAATVIARDDTGKPSTSSNAVVSSAITGGLLDSAVPIEHRRKLADQLIELAERERSPQLFYMLGSLYRQGDADGIAPFPQDIDRARDYLTRAAVAGHLAAMSKLARLELDSGNQFRANLWAQLYVHYSALEDPAKTANPKPLRAPTGNDNEAALLLALTLDGFPKSDIPRLTERANDMLARYDTAIRTYIKEQKEEEQKTSFPRTSARTATNVASTQLLAQLGREVKWASAEYFVEFSADGSFLRAWPFDGWPEHKVLPALKLIVNGYVLDPAPAGTTENRVVVIPVLYINQNYRPKQTNDTE
ncbi:MAG: hypothetical protein WBP11_01820 [Dokdonella sp.]